MPSGGPPGPDRGRTAADGLAFELEELEDSLDAILPKLSEEDLEELAVERGVMPVWMAEPLSTRLAHG